MSKEFVVVDAEFHHIPLEAVRESATKADPAEGKDPRVLVQRPSKTYQRVFDIEYAIRHMEESGVDMALVGLAPWSALGLEVCKAINDGFAKLATEYPGKFIPLAHVPLLEGQRAIDELERANKELGLKGVTVLTSQQDIRLDDQQLKPFFKKVSQLRMPVIVHPTIKAPIWGGDKYNMSSGVSREYEILKAFVEVLLGILPEFPDLNFLFSHFGGGVPFLLGNIMSRYRPKDLRIPEERIGLSFTIREFQDYGLEKGFYDLFDRMHINMAGTGGWMPAVKQALLAIKPERLCFASDYPFNFSRPEDLKAYVDDIKGMDISDEDKSKILEGNVRRLFES